MVLMAMLVAIGSLGFGDTVVQCGQPEDEARVCDLDVACTSCDGDPGSCPYIHYTKTGPYVYSLQAGNICYQSTGIIACQTICFCYSGGNYCSSLALCGGGYFNCTTTYQGPYWYAIGICGQGSPCDEG